jgi:succinoglycan biosynthesis protein ExoO
LFVGSGNSFNAEGLGWFLREVWPLLARMLPGTRLDVCGSIDQAMPQRPEGVNFHGNVPDLAPFYREAGVVIVPLLRASGLNIKLVDAAAAGRAIVATSITLVGAPFLRGAVHTADTAANFAAAIHLLLTDTVANRASVTLALAAVRTHLSPVVCYGSLGQRLRAAA